MGELATNCYIVAEGKNCIIIDPADAPEFIAEEIQRKNLNPLAIIATHGHFDHILGVAGLKMIFNIPFWLHKKDEFLMNNMLHSSQRWLNRRINELNPKIDKYLKNKEKISMGGSASGGKIEKDYLEIIETPGHTPGSICLYGKKNKILFAGDLLFKGAIGRTDFSYGDSGLMENSLKKILNLPKETMVYPGHGEKTIIGNEMPR